MGDGRPAYLGGTQSSGLQGLEPADLQEKQAYVKPERQLSSGFQLVQRPAVIRPSGFADPSWLLRTDPREVQIEALRRSYAGFALYDTRSTEEAEAEQRFKFLRTGPARGWAHFLQQRLGKTPIMLNEFELFRRDHGFKWMIQLTPARFKEDWPLEAEKFGASFPGHSFQSSKRKAASQFVHQARKEGGIIAVNYEALKSEETLRFLGDLTGELVYIGADESVNIKTPGSAQAKGAVQLAKMCAARRLASGKPATQGAHDFWMQLRFIGAISGFDYTIWRNQFCTMGGFQGKIVTGYKNEKELYEILDPMSWSARRTEWMTTHKTDYAVRRVDMLPEQAALYKQMQTEFLIELQDGTVITADQIVTKLLKLQQISSGFIIDEQSKEHLLMPLDKNPKINEVIRMLEEEVDGKVIIFAHFTKSMDNLLEALKKYQPAIIRGEAWHKKNDRDTQAEKNRYNNDPACRVMIGQEKAIKYGHTLMGNEADPCLTEFFYENSYSLDDRSQCEERPQGAGQQGSITVWDFIASEQDMAPVRALQRKEDVSSVLMRYVRENGILPPPPESVDA